MNDRELVIEDVSNGLGQVCNLSWVPECTAGFENGLMVVLNHARLL